MKLLQCSFTPGNAWSEPKGLLNPKDASLVFAFGQRAPLSHPESFAALRTRFPTARIVLVSTAGSFSDTVIEDASIVCTAVSFDHIKTVFAMERLVSSEGLVDTCNKLAASLSVPGLRHVLIFSDGSIVNGTTLSEAFNESLPSGVTMSGGLAGDGFDFVQTLVGLDQPAAPGVIVAIGLCGSSLRIGFGSVGGWTPFGPERSVTSSDKNTLLQLDGKPALELYKMYLGHEADSLPASALRFPLYVTAPGQKKPVVRTILSVDEDKGSMTFAGDIPVNSTAQLMRSSYEDLIAGAEHAAVAARQEAELVLCVSCVGRRIVLGQRVEEELEGVRATFGNNPVLTGFYSYGELAPSGHDIKCQLHNQTMTITSISERE